MAHNDPARILAVVSFTLRGRRGSQVVTVTWTDGHLWGDPDAIAMILRFAQAYEGKLVGPIGGGPYTTHEHLESPYSAYALIQSVFVMCRTELVAGGLPPLPRLPPGAIR